MQFHMLPPKKRIQKEKPKKSINRSVEKILLPSVNSLFIKSYPQI